jgi:ketosteroid isomerase-like protein
MEPGMDAAILARLDRVESIDAIRQIASKYALAVDMRDIDAIANLYVEDVRISREVSGRQAMKESFASVLRAFTASVHHIGGHIIEFDDADNAHGIVYTRAEHEVGDRWVPMYLYYIDSYRRDGGRWFIKRRVPCELYAADINERPVGPGKVRWPDRPVRDGTWHAHFPSWAAFWANPNKDHDPVPPPPPADGFIDTMRRGDRKVIPPDFGWARTGKG